MCSAPPGRAHRVPGDCSESAYNGGKFHPPQNLAPPYNLAPPIPGSGPPPPWGARARYSMCAPGGGGGARTISGGARSRALLAPSRALLAWIFPGSRLPAQIRARAAMLAPAQPAPGRNQPMISPPADKLLPLSGLRSSTMQFCGVSGRGDFL